ncbi:MAG TPA: HlyD family efflux transporter periplasmic adaptor subunit [Chloroflexota bacterium]|nr:HlyD family efflux transporter periplasmic adaptor subunit [Chloroflexota bacterium]
MPDGEQVRTEAPPGVGHPNGTTRPNGHAAVPPPPPASAAAPAAPAGGPPTHAAPQPAPAMSQAAPAIPAPKRGGRLKVVLFPLLLVALVGGAAVGYRYYYDSTHFVSTDNAQLAGRLVQVGPLVAGRVAEVRYDVGQRVAKDTVVARVAVPVPVGTTVNGQPRLEFRQTEDAMVDVTAPADGVVVARSANPGDTVPAGQPLLTLVDPRQLWVNANVEETQFKKLAVGQRVTVHVDTLDADLPAHVAAITPASAATFSLIPAQNVSGNYTKVTQLLPVKIELDQPDPRLAIGTSVEVRIQVAE